MDNPVVGQEMEKTRSPGRRGLTFMTWSPVIYELSRFIYRSGPNRLRDSTQTKVPPDENNFSWARLSLLRCLRPVENKTREAESPLSLPTHAWNFGLKYSINSLLEPVTRPVISRRTQSYSEKIRQEKDVHWKGNQDFQDQDLVIPLISLVSSNCACVLWTNERSPRSTCC